MMPTPFPGMDPYLERSGLWHQIQVALAVEIQHFLTPLLRPRYHVSIEERTYLTVLPPTGEPEKVVERYLEVHDVVNREVVTVIEILSPTNKTVRKNRIQYEHKRLEVLSSLTHLIEIDLIRKGKPFSMKIKGKNDYRIIISRSPHRPSADIYLFGVRDKIPDFPIPLRDGEPEPVLPLNKIVHDLYDLGGYDLVIDYQQPPVPALSKEDAQWATQLLNSNN
ncbi:DUF4058 family protein [Candidatus Parabeggiatoa sp. HSG14]|uniref:DUF4058 family protein n=1 Tax=Candidatus Parabeggiatoa sp. HSG14 TaxID=3055593 RepID=UPI0025A70162|nr:DUF4058 family protein [Thiotrichales bacterium HSG14]